jgi:flagellar basal body rod protein FlgC
MTVPFDPSKTQPIDVRGLRRQTAEFKIGYDPNNGALSFGGTGFTDVELIGCLTWVLHMKMAQNMDANKKGMIEIPRIAVPQVKQ